MTMKLETAKPMTPDEIEKVLIDAKENNELAPCILVPCLRGVPYDSFFLMPEDIVDGSIDLFLDDLNITERGNPNMLYYLSRLYRTEYAEATIKKLRTT